MITVYKAKRLLEYSDASGKIVFTCPVSLGSCPEGAKQLEGDGKTPEGSYRICTVNRNSKYHIALGISYPGVKDAQAAYRLKRITFAELCIIRVAHALGLRPPWKTPLGGFVMLHGSHPDGRLGDWTAGCIALSDKDIETLASMCRKGERIQINE